MVRIRTADELILNAIDFYRAAQPDLDTKPGTVARDLFIDGPNTQLAIVYDELSRNRTAQSIRLATGSDLDKYAANYGAVRKQGSAANGTALLTFSVIEADITISIGDLITANNGASFRVTQGITVSVTSISQYRATASKYRADLDFVGITDEYAVEVLVECTSTGILGNIPKYSLITSTTPGVSNVTNTVPFSNGSGSETDQIFRNRVLGIFSGANTGTALGYKNAVISDRAVIDAIVVEPGDELMTRDGTVVMVQEDGSQVITSEGTGGKVDVYVQGFRFVEILNSFIYLDKSNRNDPTASVNDYTLGQRPQDSNKTVSRKRIENLRDGNLPDQPVNNIVQVSGSLSGPNFKERAVDELGRVSGNYVLIRDTGAFGGSPWGFDRLHWIDNTIRDFSEDQTKGKFNGQDSLTYSDVSAITSCTQNISVINENSVVSRTDKSLIQLQHFPVTAVTRVFNLTTGERYTVINQNPDGNGAINETGRIKITGSTLPATSDILQVDYTWIFNYDEYIDFDNRFSSKNPRSVIDSVDWGYSNAVSREESIIQSVGNTSQVLVTHPISSVINVNTFTQNTSSVQLVSGRLSVVVSSAVTNIASITRVSDGAELFNTAQDDGSFSGFTIFLPTDTSAQVSDQVIVIYNTNDLFSSGGVIGSFSSNVITLPSSGAAPGTIVEVSYIADVKIILPQTLITALPAIRNYNTFTTTTSQNVGTQPVTNVFSFNDIVKNLRNAPTRLQLNIAGQISPGTITISGITTSKIAEAVFRVSNSGLLHDLSSQIKKYLGLSSSANISSNIFVSRVVSVEKVTTNDNMDVLSSDYNYNLNGYKLNNNSYDKSNAVQDTGISMYEFAISNTSANILNQPVLGDSLRVTFYINNNSDSENVSFSKSGNLFTQKRFAIINTISVSSGFTSANSQTATISVSNMNQPSSSSRYSVFYDYLAPKSNERISIRYNKNSVITDATFAIERVRPISADVLAKAGIPKIVDARFAIVLESSFINSAAIVKQNLIDALTSALNATALGTTIDESDLINVCYQVSGVDRVRPIAFNLENLPGRVLSISANKNEYIQSGTVIIDIESR